MLFEKSTEWSAVDSFVQAEKTFTEYASSLSLDTEKFETCLTNNTYRDAVQEDYDEAISASVNSTPTLFINEERFAGVGAYATLRKKIQEHLEIAKAAEETSADTTEEKTEQDNEETETSN